MCFICSSNKRIDYFKIADMLLKVSILYLRHDIMCFGRQFMGCVEGFYILFIYLVLFVVYLTFLPLNRTEQRHVLDDNELKKMWKKAAEVQCTMINRNLPTGTEEVRRNVNKISSSAEIRKKTEHTL
jgi:hypothetical protein